MRTKEHQELLELYRKLTKREVQDNGERILIIQANGTKLNLKYDVAIKTMTEYVNAKTGKKPVKIKSVADIFKIRKPKQVKKQWKAIGCSMTMEELAEIDKIMKENEIKTYNQFLRLFLLNLIEAHKNEAN